MLRGSSSLTPIYFFSSVRSGSGKSTIVSNLSVLLNDLKYKVVVLDLDYTAPQKLKSTYPDYYELQEYDELSNLVSNENPRFQKNSYFSDTDLVSFFPCHKLKNPNLLMTDTAFRDFFLQISVAFDFVLINLPPGTKQSQKVSELLAKSYLWRNSKPSSVIISTSEEKSLIELDQFIHSNQLVGYQSEENTYFLFNKVPRSEEEQSYNDNLLNILELRNLFPYPLIYVIPHLDEFLEQRNGLNTYVLQRDSSLNQYILGLSRMLSGSTSLSYLMKEINSYQSCISGKLLSRVYPYLEELQKAVATRLFIDQSEVQLFLEQNEHNFRIRIRLNSIGQKLLGIKSNIEIDQKPKISKDFSPAAFETINPRESLRTIGNEERETAYTLSFKSIFTFDDSFYSNPITVIQKEIPIAPIKSRYPSPILFPQRQRLKEIPTLSNILGISNKRTFLPFSEKSDEIGEQGVKPFYIPKEFHLSFDLDSKFSTKYFIDSKFIRCNDELRQDISLPANYQLCSRKLEEQKIYDIFSRNKTFEFSSGFGIKTNRFCYKSMVIKALPVGNFSLFDERQRESRTFIEPVEAISSISESLVPKYALCFDSFLLIMEETEKEEDLMVQALVAPQYYNQSDFNISKQEFYFPDSQYHRLAFPDNNLSIDKEINFKKIKLGEKKGLATGQKAVKTPRNYTHTSIVYLSKVFFLEKGVKPLTKSIGLEDLMLDYCYDIRANTYQEANFKLDKKTIKAIDYCPKFNCKFEHKYMEPDLLIRRRYTYKKPIMYQLFYLRKLAISSKVIVTNADYKVAYNEIFPVIYFPKPSHIYLNKNIQQPKQLDHLWKGDSESNQFKMVISPISLFKEKPSPYNTHISSTKHRFSKGFASDLPESKASYLVFAPNRPDLSKDYLKFEVLKLKNCDISKKLGFTDETELNKSDYKNSISDIRPDFAPLCLFIERMRFRSERFYTYDWKSFKAEILKVSTSIKDKTPIKIQSAIHHEPGEIGGFKPAYRKKYPVLSKSLKLINNFTDLYKIKPTFEYLPINADASKGKISVFKGGCQRLENLFSQRYCRLEYEKPEISKGYVLKKIAVKPPVPKLRRSLLYVLPESPLETLYKHLLWQLKNNHSEIICRFDNELKLAEPKDRADSFYIKYGHEPIKPIADFLPHDEVVKRLDKSFGRKPYKVASNCLKDLLALAKAQSKAASESLAAIENNV